MRGVHISAALAFRWPIQPPQLCISQHSLALSLYYTSGLENDSESQKTNGHGSDVSLCKSFPCRTDTVSGKVASVHIILYFFTSGGEGRADWTR